MEIEKTLENAHFMLYGKMSTKHECFDMKIFNVFIENIYTVKNFHIKYCPPRKIPMKKEKFVETTKISFRLLLRRPFFFLKNLFVIFCEQAKGIFLFVF